MPKFILSAFGDEIAAPLDAQMDVLESLGIYHIELRGADGQSVASSTNAQARSIHGRMQARGFAASAIGSPIGKYPIRDPFPPQFDAFRRCLDVARILGAPYIRLFSFFMPAGEDPGLYRDAVMERMSRFIEANRGSGVTLLHENEREIYGDIAARNLDLLQTFPGDLWLTYDPSNFVQCNEDNRAAFEMLRGYIRYMHIKDSVYPKAQTSGGHDMGFQNVSDNHRLAGDGDGHVEWILTELWNAGYEGYLSIEPHLTTYDGVPGTSQDKFRAAAGALKAMIGRVCG